MSAPVLECLLLFLLWIPSECRLQEHRQFQYNSQTDERGTYNFAYDTSHQPSDAHSLRMEYRDANGIVRGRYGYTDPRGNLRIVEYEAGPDGFEARGDVGPDLFPHMEAPDSSRQKGDPAPAPLRLAEWDPTRTPINEKAATESGYYSSYSSAGKTPRSGYVRYSDDPNQVYSSRPPYPPVSQTADKGRGDVGPDPFPLTEDPGLSQKPDSAPTPLRMAGWDPERNPINQRVVVENDSPYSSVWRTTPRRGYFSYPDHSNQGYSSRPPYAPVSQTVVPEVEIFQQGITTNVKKSKPLTRGQPLTIYNIDVDPDEIRVAGPPASAESRSPVASSVPAYGQGSTDIITTSPEITYYDRSPRRRLSQINHYHDSDPREKVRYYSRGQGIQYPRRIRYVSQADFHGQQYHFH